MSTIIELDEDQFASQYNPMANHLNPNASFDWGDGFGTLFETYGKELEFVLQQDRLNVWTIVDGDDGDLYVISGLHFVNRIGYLISRVPFDEHLAIQVRLPSSDDEEDGNERIDE